MTGRLLLVSIVALVLLAVFQVAHAQAHLVAHPHSPGLYAQANSQMANLYHARYVCRHGAGQHRRWACKARVWLARELRETRSRIHSVNLGDARARTIAAAEQIRSRGGNPWPRCPDPNDGASWDATKACESPGYGWNEDPPGYFCGPLQFDPEYWGALIRKYRIPC